MNRKRFIQYILLFAALFAAAAMIFIRIRAVDSKKSELSGFRLSSDDQCITVSWDEVSFLSVQNIEISISGTEYQKTVSLSPLDGTEYQFKEGSHGQLYTISANLVYKDGTMSETQEKSALFLDYNLLPQDVPLLEITTADYTEPEAEIVEPSKNYMWGISITNNEYVKGTMTLTGNGRNLSVGMEIRVRGNTSADYYKKPYRLKLDQPLDLINEDGNNADTDWILLAYTGKNLNTYLGGYIGSLCGLQWQPRMMYVNVMLNGDWKGCYVLIESVKRSTARINVEAGGCIFENDAYWWNTDIYFKTENQSKGFGFTFKYPDIVSSSDDRITALQSYMQDVEDKIIDGDSSVCSCLDLDSWAAWLMARDILGNGDAGGANIYYYILDLSSSDPADKKIYMGPLWDFDVIYAAVSDWSLQHSTESLYFPYLLKMPEFREVYEEKWNDIYPHLLENIRTYMEELNETQGTGLEESRQLDSARWQSERPSLKNEMETAEQFFAEQIAWMNRQISAGLE